jgi:cytochrome c peroxidase
MHPDRLQLIANKAIHVPCSSKALVGTLFLFLLSGASAACSLNRADSALTDTGSPGDAGGASDGGRPTGNVRIELPNSTGIATAVFARPLEPDDGLAASTSFGSNGRTCDSCHDPANASTLTIDAITGRFNTGVVDGSKRFATNAEARSNDELDPLFRANDGTLSPSADLSTSAARARAYDFLVRFGVLRVGLPMPSSAGLEFTLQSVQDPAGHAGAAELSLFRRPLPMANLQSSTTLMWDGRETEVGLSLLESLKNQAIDATLGHAQAAAPPSEQDVERMVSDELLRVVAQSRDNVAGALDADGALGGPDHLLREMAAPNGTASPMHVFTLFEAWATLVGDDPQSAQRRSIARGEALFNTREFPVRNISGLNDELGQATVEATCATCHNAPNSGHNLEGKMFDDLVSKSSGLLTPPLLPVYTFENTSTGELLQTTDPGRALISGRWKDMNRFKVPGLRGLATRAPYFHDGMIANLPDAVGHYIKFLDFAFTREEKQDLVAFLSAL